MVTPVTLDQGAETWTAEQIAAAAAEAVRTPHYPVKPDAVPLRADYDAPPVRPERAESGAILLAVVASCVLWGLLLLAGSWVVAAVRGFSAGRA